MLQFNDLKKEQTMPLKFLYPVIIKYRLRKLKKLSFLIMQLKKHTVKTDLLNVLNRLYYTLV